MTTVAARKHYQIQGMMFGVRKCSSSGSCTCNPCDCNPCKCGDSVDIPDWRVSGYAIDMGSIQDIPISGLLVVSLAQPVEEGKNDLWQEVLLVDARATSEQVVALLDIFEPHLESMPAEVQPQSDLQRAVYLSPVYYHDEKDEAILLIQFSPEQANLVRQGAVPVELGWIYDGPVAVRGAFEFHG